MQSLSQSKKPGSNMKICSKKWSHPSVHLSCWGCHAVAVLSWSSRHESGEEINGCWLSFINWSNIYKTATTGFQLTESHYLHLLMSTLKKPGIQEKDVAISGETLQSIFKKIKKIYLNRQPMNFYVVELHSWTRGIEESFLYPWLNLNVNNHFIVNAAKKLN